ncbi:hypothetical protein EVAR_27050_1 [Eumeta japonica]|uniref:Uncharacterized protein n=1 Tax=Eumeta variegata TaxID=151549 RepID=A0A4C1WD99_EUMVA|nr:hypothetical protein EVAR_27050_1 [Eumeta japonica]
MHQSGQILRRSPRVGFTPPLLHDQYGQIYLTKRYQSRVLNTHTKRKLNKRLRKFIANNKMGFILKRKAPNRRASVTPPAAPAPRPPPFLIHV